jgi:hypothetical protein
VTDLPSKITGDWTEGPFRYTLASSGGGHVPIFVHWGVNRHTVDKSGG